MKNETERSRAGRVLQPKPRAGRALQLIDHLVGMAKDIANGHYVGRGMSREEKKRLLFGRGE